MSCSSAPVTAMSRSIPGKVAEIALTAWPDGERVLEQAVAVGLVVVLRRRARRGSAGQRAARDADQPLEQGVRSGGRWTVAISCAQIGLHLLGSRTGPSKSSSSVVAARVAARAAPRRLTWAP